MSGQTVLITGAGSGIGRLTAITLARAGHTVFASMRDPEGRNADRAHELTELAADDGIDLRVVALDVQSQDSADEAVRRIAADAGGLDVVVHNAGHLLVGYTEAFTAEDIAHLVDVNMISAQRVNRAALPHLRQQRSGTLVWVGSTSVVSVPPFLGPYVASKAAFDVLAQVTAYEVGQLGIETVIVMPGAFTSGTRHFQDAGHASDETVAAAYAELDPLVARNEEATANLADPSVDSDPQAVADEIARVLDLPVGEKPVRTVVDFTRSHVDHVNEVALAERDDFVRRLGFEQLLTVRR